MYACAPLRFPPARTATRAQAPHVHACSLRAAVAPAPYLASTAASTPLRDTGCQPFSADQAAGIAGGHRSPRKRLKAGVATQEPPACAARPRCGRNRRAHIPTCTITTGEVQQARCHGSRRNRVCSQVALLAIIAVQAAMGGQPRVMPQKRAGGLLERDAAEARRWATRAAARCAACAQHPEQAGYSSCRAWCCSSSRRLARSRAPAAGRPAAGRDDTDWLPCTATAARISFTMPWHDSVSRL
jgi:hypothetical protein